MRVTELLDSWNDALLSLVRAPVESAPTALAPFTDDRAPERCYGPVSPVRLQWQVRVQDEGADERFRYASPRPSGDARNDRVAGRRWRLPETRLSGTALLVLHAAFAPNHSHARRLTRTAVRNGAHVYAISLPYHMSRQPADSRFSGQRFLSGDVPRLVSGFLQGVADVRALIRSLHHLLGYRRVLLGGVGFGGTIAALAAPHETLDGVFLVAPVPDPFRALWESPLGEPVKRAARAHGFDDDAVRAALRCITPTRLPAPRLAPEQVFVAYGTEDILAPADATRELLRHWGEPASRAYRTGHRLIANRLGSLERGLGRWVEALGRPGDGPANRPPGGDPGGAGRPGAP